jgi:hypothetical protein
MYVIKRGQHKSYAAYLMGTSITFHAHTVSENNCSPQSGVKTEAV